MEDQSNLLIFHYTGRCIRLKGVMRLGTHLSSLRPVKTASFRRNVATVVSRWQPLAYAGFSKGGLRKFENNEDQKIKFSTQI